MQPKTNMFAHLNTSESPSWSINPTFEVILQRDVEVEAVRAVGEPQSEVRVVDGDDKVPRAVADGLGGDSIRQMLA